jgi:FtsH ternary system-associated peptide
MPYEGAIMSRAYKVKVKESLARDVQVKDEIEARLEIFEILPPEQMSEMLARELEQRGFERQEDGTLVRKGKDGVSVTVEPCNGRVTIEAEAGDHIKVEATRDGFGYDDIGPSKKTIEQRIGKELRGDLEKRIEQQAEQLQRDATNKLEKQLEEIRPVLDEAVNRVTAEALKQKAAQIGQIKEISEDAQSGSLTIKVEV